MNKQKACKIIIPLLFVMFVTTLSSRIGLATEHIKLVTSQTLYVPIYSHIYSGVKARPFDLAAILSIRNTDPKYPITIVSVSYYDSDGKLVKDYLTEPVTLNHLQSTRYIITEGDRSGGSGANFIVKWKSTRKVNPPIVEGVMIGTRSGQGISFVSRSQVIEEHGE